MVIARIYSAGSHLRCTAVLPQPGEISIAINDAINQIPFVDWYAAADWQAYLPPGVYEMPPQERLPPPSTVERPRVGWCCLDAVYRRRILNRKEGWEDLKSLVWDDLPYLHDITPPVTYSITAAYLLAAYLGATHAFVYGADGTDEKWRYDANRRKREDDDRAQVARLTGMCIERILCHNHR